MSERKPYRVLLYYKFIEIEDYEVYAAEHLAFCKELGLKGRIIVAKEGINGTVCGTFEQTEKYMEAMHKDPRFSDLWFKIDEEEDQAFKKMFVRPRASIITLNAEDDLNPNEVTGKHISPKEWHELLEQEDVVILDGRNGYEYDLGHFRNAVRPSVEAFKEFPQWIKENFMQYKDKKVLTYCTGGIRCEKLSGVLLKEGFKDVYQLDGGIVTYGKDPEVKGDLFDGKCYVFDERISVPINQVEEVVVGKCHHCGKPSDKYINCANDNCHNHHIVCDECEAEFNSFCSQECIDYAALHPERNSHLRKLNSNKNSA